jgi:L,D-transpeptidase catalytic domain
MSLSRRQMLGLSACGLIAATTHPAFAAPAIAPELLRRARQALDRHSAQIPNRDLIAVADFSLPSYLPRFHLVDVAAGRVTSHLVAHGRGSDPRHTGWLERFSNDPGSYATCAGAFRTDGFYTGAHGRSIRLSGLDPSNDNALGRAIVVHGAWYVSEGMAASRGVLGRSEGCFALSASSLNSIMERMGPGHMIYSAKIGDHPDGPNDRRRS